jgi:hypothetical protein
MVARVGVETADASLFRPSSTSTYNYSQVCGRLPNTCKHLQGGAILGWDHGLNFVCDLPAR